MNILHIDSCAMGDHSASRITTAAVIAALTETRQQANVLYRDLAAAPLSHASGPLLQVLSQRWDTSIPMNTELRAEVLQSASLQQEFLDADLIVIGAPMHNFGAPSALKAWMDRLIELQSAACSKRDVRGRVLLVTSGCVDEEPSPTAELEHYESLLKAAFQCMGAHQQTAVRALSDLPQALHQSA